MGFINVDDFGAEDYAVTNNVWACLTTGSHRKNIASDRSIKMFRSAGNVRTIR